MKTPSTFPRRRRATMAVTAVALTSALVATATALQASATPDRDDGAHHATAGQDTGEPLSQKELQREVDRVLKKAGFTGMSVQIRDGHHRVHAVAGERERGTGRPVSHRAAFRAASVTKTFVATVVLQLVSEGRLSLDDTVEKWLPGVVKGNGNDGSRITVRNLLQHTSGVYNYDLTEETGETAADFERTRLDHHGPEDSLAGAMKHEPDFPPADPDDPEPDWNYSNPGYMLAGMIIEKATGKTWDEEVRNRIVRPLGLTQTYSPGDDPRLKGPYTHNYQQFPGSSGFTDTSVRNISQAHAAGQLISSERDLDRFLTALQRGELLPPAQQAELRGTVPVSEQYQKIFPGLEYGLGVMRQPLSCGGFRWGHGGDLEGATIRTGVSEDGRRSVVLTASGKKSDEDWLYAAEDLMQDLVDKGLCGKDTAPAKGGADR